MRPSLFVVRALDSPLFYSAQSALGTHGRKSLVVVACMVGRNVANSFNVPISSSQFAITFTIDINKQVPTNCKKLMQTILPTYPDDTFVQVMYLLLLTK